MKATNYILNALKHEGIDHLFMVPGGLVDPFLAEFETCGVEPIVAAHEAGAAFMADGYARSSGRFGVCMGIGGPGVANMVGPIAAAYADQVPLLALIGEVPTDWDGRGAFQDASPAGLNDIGFLQSISAVAEEIPAASLVPHHLHTALRTMLGITRRPVCLSLPRQIQSEPVQQSYRPLNRNALESPHAIDLAAAAELAQHLQQGAKIALLAGSGCMNAQASADLQAFAEQYQIPVATTLRAKGVLAEDHPQSLGVFGYAGSPHATEALLGHDVDTLLVLGSSLNQRDTMFWNARLEPRQNLIQVDIDPAVFDRNYPVDVAIVSDVRAILRYLLQHDDAAFKDTLSAGQKIRADWLQDIQRQPRFYDADEMGSNALPIHPARVVTELRQAAPRDTVALVDSGAHRAFTGHYWMSYGPNEYLTSTTLAPMGWAIPAAIGAKLARPGQPVAAVTGDGCMLMHGIELQTAAKHGIPMVLVVINNSALGNVYLRARTLSPAAGQLVKLNTHDWVQFARALNGEGITVKQPDELAPAFAKAFAWQQGPFVVDVRCDPDVTTPITPWSQAKQDWQDHH